VGRARAQEAITAARVVSERVSCERRIRQTPGLRSAQDAISSTFARGTTARAESSANSTTSTRAQDSVSSG